MCTNDGVNPAYRENFCTFPGFQAANIQQISVMSRRTSLCLTYFTCGKQNGGTVKPSGRQVCENGFVDRKTAFSIGFPTLWLP